MPHQLLLDLSRPPPATFDNFIADGNLELIEYLRNLAASLTSRTAHRLADRTYYLWGPPGSGRSHLLHALCHAACGQACYLGPSYPPTAFEFDPRVALYAIDDCDALSNAQQIALFHLFNEVYAHPASILVAAGATAPLGLAMREDLRTRLGWGLVFQLTPLSDAAKLKALMHAAHARGIALDAEVPAYLLKHCHRDMPNLMAWLNALDRFSLEHKRTVTLPLVRTMLAQANASNRFK